jgi:zinc protease
MTMKKFMIMALALAPIIVVAQGIDRSKAPTPKPAPEIKIGDVESFDLANGLKVFVVQNKKLPRVSVTLTIDRDPVLEGNKAGMLAMVGPLLRRGTSKMTKAQLDEEIDFLGATMNTSSTGVSVQSLSNNFPRVFELMADVIFRASMPADELEKIRKQQLSALKNALNNPSSISSNVVNRLTYGKEHPYGTVRTEETIKSVTVDDIKNYIKTYWKPNISYLVFVGDISQMDAKRLTNQYFASWQKGDVPKTSYTYASRPEKNVINLVDRPASVQSVITLAHVVELKPGTPDVIPTSVMSNLMGGGFSSRLMQNLREKYGFTYGASGSVGPDKYIGSFTAGASVRNEKTDSAIGQFLYELNRVRNEVVDADELNRIKNNMSGSFARSLENPATIAAFALNIARYNLPKDYYRNYLKNLAKVTPQQVQMMARKYILPDNMHIVVVGNAKQVAPGLEKYGPVKYYDVYGNEVKP